MSHNFFEATRCIYGPIALKVSSVKTTDGTSLLKSNEAILQCWKEHFQSLLNHPRTVDDDIIARLPQYPIKPELDLPPSIADVLKAVNRMKNNRASGPDGIPLEAFKHGGPQLTSKLHQLCLTIWTEEIVPKDLKDALIVTIFKKGNKTECGNYHGISLLSNSRKDPSPHHPQQTSDCHRACTPWVSVWFPCQERLSTWCLLQDSCRRSVENTIHFSWHL